jgi:hypothetical protein
VVNVSSRLDVNLADATTLARVLAAYGPADVANRTAAAIRRAVDADGITARPFLSLEALTTVPGVDTALVARASADLTVDGDGQVHLPSASAAVRAALGRAGAAEPTRVLVLARGWHVGHPTTHEVQAVYQLEGAQLTFVRWRERDR